MSVTGSPESGPVKVGAPVLDVGAGLSCALGLLAAHIERLSAGVGRHVSSSLLEFALFGMGTMAAAYFVSGESPGLFGTHSPTFAPYGGFRTADGWIVLAGAGSEDLWIRCCEVLGLEELTSDPRFIDNAARVANRDALTEYFECVLLDKPSSHWLELLETAGVPSSQVRDVAEVFEWPQTKALGSVQLLEHPEVGPYEVVSVPLRIDQATLAYPGPAPVLGADTHAVLSALGMDDAGDRWPCRGRGGDGAVTQTEAGAGIGGGAHRSLWPRFQPPAGPRLRGP